METLARRQLNTEETNSREKKEQVFFLKKRLGKLDSVN